MQSYVMAKDSNGHDVKIEIILSFRVEEYNKNYIVYTLNDDGISDFTSVVISEYDKNNNKLISIPFDEKETVLKIYEEVKQMIMEN